MVFVPKFSLRLYFTISLKFALKCIFNEWAEKLD